MDLFDVHGIGERLTTFRDDLRAQLTSWVVQKHVMFGDCWALDPPSYFELKREVAEQFRVNPAEIFIVGSAKLGFSIAPRKRYRHFGEKSDIDVAIVSGHLFDHLWMETWKYVLGNPLADWERRQEFEDHLFEGWIRPDMFPGRGQFECGKEWWEFFQNLTSSGRYGYPKISGGVYRSFLHLETYQSVCVEKCAEAECDEA